MKNYKDIKTFENACEYLGLDAEKVIPNMSAFIKEDQKALESHAKLIIIIKALNKIENDGKEWFPNYSNNAEKKHYPWFDMNDNSSTSGFSYIDCDIWNSCTSVGSRLCYKSSGLAKYAGTQFLELYNSSFVKNEICVKEITKESLDGKTATIDGVEYTLKLNK